MEKSNFFLKFLPGIFLLFFTLQAPALAGVYPYNEVPDPGIIFSLQSMRAHQTAMTNWLNYTLNVDTPGYVETGAYNIRTKDGDIECAPFYRWRNGPPVESDRELNFFCNAKGHGFFKYRLPGGKIGYSRDGCLELDSNNRLVSLSHEFPVLSENNEEIYLPEGKITCSSSGVLFVSGEPVDKFGVAVFTNESRNNMVSINGVFFVYSAPEGGKPEPDLLIGEQYYQIKQYFVDQSSVLKALIGDVGLAKHSYESSAKLARSITKSLTSVVQMANP
ncbi:hypothetical protein ACFLZV_05530 [Candidatus Margulisiibacteriota bacterium]